MIYGGQCKDRYHLLYEYLGNFIEGYNGVAKFAVLWISEPTHDTINGLYGLDKVFDSDPIISFQFIASFLREHQRALENSFVFMMGDHGLRHGSSRKTNIGEQEDYNPMLMLAVPRHLRSNDQLLLNMRINSRRHVSHFDVHATLVDILYVSKMSCFNNFDFYDFRFETLDRKEQVLFRQQLGEARGKRALSLLRPIKTDRSCLEMEIARSFCLCQETWQQVSNKDDI
jgi:hypothetical protein